jgi:hypothetical protein
MPYGAQRPLRICLGAMALVIGGGAGCGSDTASPSLSSPGNAGGNAGSSVASSSSGGATQDAPLPGTAGQGGTNLATLGPGGIGAVQSQPLSTLADACGGLATGLSIHEVAVYQTVKIAVDTDGTEIAAGSRNADVVTGRDAVFRIQVAVASGWTARPLSARVWIRQSTDATPTLFFSKATISASSVEADVKSTFQVTVPKDSIDLDTAYAVEVVECTSPAPAGDMVSPRFPAGTDFAAVGARSTGGLQVEIIPIMANGRLPDTSDAGLAIYQAIMLAMYPIDSFDLTVGAPMTLTTYPIDWVGALDQLRARRATDAPPAEVYYFGLVKPEDTLAKFCGNSCTMGIGYVTGTQSGAAQGRVAMGAGFGDSLSALVMPHEVGHNHGRNHAPCVTAGGMITGIDPNFPDPNGKDGVYGWDARSMALMGPTRTDVMGYCNSKWISDYTYQGLLEHVAAVNAALSVYTVAPAPSAPSASTLELHHVLLVDGKGPRWGIRHPVPMLPGGTPEMADILDASGKVLQQIEVYRTGISDLDASSIEIPAPRPGWVSVRVAGAPPIAFQR